MTTGEAVSEVRLNSGFIEFHNLDRQEQLDRKTTTTKPVQKETPRTPSKMARPYLPNPVMLQYHLVGNTFFSEPAQSPKAYVDSVRFSEHWITSHFNIK